MVQNISLVGADRELYGRKDASIYTKGERAPALHRAWDQVRGRGER